MKFEEVLPALREGKKIRRKDIVWQNYYGFLFISETENEIFSDNVENCDYKITKEDLNSNDWEIIEDKKIVKLRDLTDEDYKKFIDNSCKNLVSDNKCKNCAFQNVNCYYFDKNCWINHHKSLYSNTFLGQEIEIEEN